MKGVLREINAVQPGGATKKEKPRDPGSKLQGGEKGN